MRTALALAAMLATTLPARPTLAAGPVCERHSAVRPPLVLELYTSEGCSSCPPADRWLSAFQGRDDVLPLAFHVGYWNRLGWVDRFATRETTDRQYRLAQAMGAANVYTPQVVAHGRDWRDWHRGGPPPASPALAPVAVRLTREGHQVTAEVTPVADPAGAVRAGNHAADGAWRGTWSGYWAVVEDSHRSRVTAGENRGETLVHDHVVRLYQPVAAGSGARRFTLLLPPADPAHARRVVFVVADPVSQRPLQAVALAC